MRTLRSPHRSICDSLNVTSRPELIERVRNGPGLLSPTRLDAVDRAVNSVEFFVHHEDVRRGEPALLWGSATRFGHKDLTQSLHCFTNMHRRVAAR